MLLKLTLLLMAFLKHIKRFNPYTQSNAFVPYHSLLPSWRWRAPCLWAAHLWRCQDSFTFPLHSMNNLWFTPLIATCEGIPPSMWIQKTHWPIEWQMGHPLPKQCVQSAVISALLFSSQQYDVWESHLQLLVTGHPLFWSGSDRGWTDFIT